MGLDVANGLFGNFHLSWAGSRWFSLWCARHDLPYPFIGWESGLNDGEVCRLGRRRKHTGAAKQWCAALEEREPDIAQLGRQLLAKGDPDLYRYLYPSEDALPEGEWSRRAVAAWYAILRNGIERGDTLEYW